MSWWWAGVVYVAVGLIVLGICLGMDDDEDLSVKLVLATVVFWPVTGLIGIGIFWSEMMNRWLR